MRISFNMTTTSINDLHNQGIDWNTIWKILGKVADMRKQQEEQRMLENLDMYQQQVNQQNQEQQHPAQQHHKQRQQ